MGLGEYLVVRGTGRVTEGGAAELLKRLARVYLGPDVRLAPGTDHPPGMILRIRPEHVGGSARARMVEKVAHPDR
jgi:hypothetical protein